MPGCQDQLAREVDRESDVSATADRLFELLARFRGPRPLHRPRDGDREEHELFRQRHGQMRMLGALLREGPLTVQDLARVLDVSAPTASVLAKKAFEDSLIERRGDESDSRVVWLEIAPGGRARVQAHRAERVRKIERLILERPDLDQREIATAVDVLLRLFAPDPIADGSVPHHQVRSDQPQRTEDNGVPEERR